MDKSTEKDAYDDSKENMLIPKTCENDFEENNDVKLENSSDSDEKQKDLKESPKKFSCPKCQKLFKTKRILKIHILRVHERQKDYICKTCKKPFFTSTHMKRHILISHRDKQKDHICRICNKAFALKDYLKRHNDTVHEGIKKPKKRKNYCCKTCGRVFSRKGGLKTHIMAIHHGIKYASKLKLKNEEDYNKQIEAILNESEVHEVINKNIKNNHDPGKPKMMASGTKRGKYKKNKSKEKEDVIHLINCELCDSVFTGKILRQCKSNLKIHIRTVHEGERNFPCHICNKPFWHPWYHKRHIQSVHEKLKPIKCNVCGKSFSEASYLKTHKNMKKACKVPDDYCQIEENEKTNNNMKSLNEKAKTSQLFNEKQKECDFCGDLIHSNDIRKHMPFVDICKP